MASPTLPQEDAVDAGTFGPGCLLCTDTSGFGFGLSFGNRCLSGADAGGFGSAYLRDGGFFSFIFGGFFGADAGGLFSFDSGC